MPVLPLQTLGQRELFARSRALKTLARPCQLCPRQCKVDRRTKRGFCGQPEELMIAITCPHQGEEPALSGTRGAGTVFVAGCTMRCGFCQNHQISHQAPKPEWLWTPEKLAQRYLELQQAGCHNIEWVSPTQHLPGLVEALYIARSHGLSLPVVYNGNGFESVEVLKLLEGVVDIYLPDLKYASNDLAKIFSATENYVEINRAALLEMRRQTGTLVLDDEGLCLRGLLIRHLVLPGLLDNTRQSVKWIASALGTETWVSLMAQYTPAHQALSENQAYTHLGRQLTKREYHKAVTALCDAQLENGWIQHFATCKHFLPNFDLPNPFAKDK